MCPICPASSCPILPTLKMWFTKLRHFLWLHYFTFFYYLQLIQEHHIHYDRRLFPSLPLYWNKYALPHYRQLYPEMENPGEQIHHLLEPLPNPGHLQFVKYFSLFFALRGFIVCGVKVATNTVEKRIFIGTAALKRDSFYVEVPLTLWVCIVALFLYFTFNRPLLHFKFLAILLMNERKEESHFHPSIFSISPSNYRRFHQFRSLCFTFYIFIMSILPPVGMVAIVFLFFLPFYKEHLLISLFWTLAFNLWANLICATIYSTLIVFILVVVYVHLKQKAILAKIEAYLGGNKPQPRTLWLSYNYLYCELLDYNTFWSGHLTVIYGFYILINCFMMYVILFTEISLFITAVFLMAFTFHVILLSWITFSCAAIVKKNSQIAFRYKCKVGKMKSPTVAGLLKLHNISEYLQENSQSGFTLLNGYLITSSTFQTLIINITIYFLLMKKSADIKW